MRLAFYSKKQYGDLKLSVGKKAISDFKKLGISNEYVAKLMLFYVETGVEFTIDFGDIDEAFYNSIRGNFDKALKLLKKENLLEKYEDLSKQINKDAGGFGWGFNDEINHIFYIFMVNINNLEKEVFRNLTIRFKYHHNKFRRVK